MSVGPIALDRFSTAFEDLHFAAFDVDLNDTDLLECVAVERAYGDVEAQGFSVYDGGSTQTSTQM